MDSSSLEGDPTPDDPNLKFLRRLIAILTGIMIGGFLLVIALLVIRLSDPGPVVPDMLELPEGVVAQAVTFGKGWIAVVTTDQRLLVFDAITGHQTDELSLLP